MKAIKEYKSYIYKPYINANKTNTLILITITTLLNYPLYKYLLKYPPKAYILESFTLIVKQCKQVFHLLGIKI